MHKTSHGLVLIAFLSVGSISSEADAAPAEDPDAAAKAKAYIEELYKHAKIVHRFTHLGEEVICVEANSQPGLRPYRRLDGTMSAPLTLETPPPEPMGRQSKPTSEAGGLVRGEQNVDVSVTGGVDEQGRKKACPTNSVPIIPVTSNKIERFNNLNEFLQKVPPGAAVLHQQGGTPPTAGIVHKYAHAYRVVDNWGIEAVFNVWRPFTETSSEFSLSQTWIVRGSGSNLETVEAGWQKYRQKYGDLNSRLFIYFTPDNYGPGGCYNNDCGKFVQISRSIIPGAKIPQSSTLGGLQKVFRLKWQRSQSTGSWWLKYGNEWVGYYPNSLFDISGLKNKGGTIDFGGEILDTIDNRHTRTDMGSGKFPNAGFKQAAYTRSIRYITTSNNWAVPSFTESRTDSRCYDIDVKLSSGNWGRHFFFGGSGLNSRCQRQ